MRLAQLHDRAETQAVAALRQIERQLRLIEQLLRQPQPVVSGGGSQPGRAHIADHAILLGGDILRGGAGLQFRFRLPGLEQPAVEDRDR